MAASDEGFQVRDRRGRADEPRQPVEASATSDRASEPAPSPGRGERSLVSLFLMLASLAIAALEGGPDADGRIQRDPVQAAELIDVLMMLREKTEGRRTADETQVLGEIIYDLQLRYVRATRGASDPGKPAER